MNAQERAAMQQALEALETPIQEQTFMQKQNAITALRAALAQQPERAHWVTYSTGGLQLEAGFYSADQLRGMLKALEAMNAAARRAMKEMK